MKKLEQLPPAHLHLISGGDLIPTSIITPLPVDKYDTDLDRLILPYTIDK